MNQINSNKNIKAYGDPACCRVIITIAKKAHDAIYIHGLLNPRQEVGGIFVGNVTQDGGGRYKVEIVATIEAESAPGNRTHMQFTGPVWLKMLGRVQDSYPGLRVVGWYHTHPNLGVFLSDDDIVVHKVAFSNPWHIAAVCDPVKRQLGFFSWDNTELKALEGFYVKEVPAVGQQDLKARRSLPDMPHIPPRSTANRIALVAAPLIFIIVVLTGISFYLALKPAFNQNKPDPAIAQALNNSAATCNYYQSNRLFTYLVHADGTIQLKIDDLETGKQTLQNLLSTLPSFIKIRQSAVHEVDIGNGKQGYLVIEADQLQNNQVKPLIISFLIERATGKLTMQNKFSISPDSLIFSSEDSNKALEVSTTDSNGVGNPRWVIKPDAMCKDWISLGEPSLSGYSSKKCIIAIKSDRMREGINAGNLNVTYGPEDWYIRWNIPVRAEKISASVARQEDKIQITDIRIIDNSNIPGADANLQWFILLRNNGEPDTNDQPANINVTLTCLNPGCWAVLSPQQKVALHQDEEKPLPSPFIIKRINAQCTEAPRLSIKLSWNIQNEYTKSLEVTGVR